MMDWMNSILFFLRDGYDIRKILDLKDNVNPMQVVKFLENCDIELVEKSMDIEVYRGTFCTQNFLILIDRDTYETLIMWEDSDELERED